MKATQEQYNAFTYKGEKPAVISASAGSGKTAVLAERVQFLLKDRESGVRADRLAVVTFTEKAAAELRSRLAARIEQEAADSGDPYLSEQLERLEDARISTISSFCLGLLKENVTLTDRDSGFSVLDETDARILQRQAAQQLLSEVYADGQLRNELSELFGSKDELEAAIFPFGEFASGLDDREGWLKRQEESFTEEGYEKAYCLPLRERAARMLEQAAALLTKAAEKIPGADGYFLAARECFGVYAQELTELSRAVGDKDKPALLSYAKAFSKRLPSAKSAEEKEAAEGIKAARDQAKKLYEKAMGYVEATISIKGEADGCKRLSRLFIRLFSRYEDIYSALKRERNAVDFSDIEQSLLKLLTQHPETAQKLRNSFDYIIVDEFQDSNDIQYRIFTLLSREGKNLYFVGDVKQCIYGFRNANPYILSSLLSDSRWQPLPMNMNFRSSDSVIDSVNAFFREDTPESFNGGLPWQDMESGLGVKADEENRTELVMIDSFPPFDGRTAEEREAAYAAKRIKEMVEQGFTVHDMGTARPVRYGDFAILLRSESARGGIYRRALEEAGIPAVTKGGRSFTDLSEITLVCNILKLLTDPFDDTAMTAVLMSPLYQFSGEDMARLRMTGCSYFYTALNNLAGSSGEIDAETPDDEAICPADPSALAAKAADFIRDYRLLRKRSYDNSTDRLLRFLYTLTGLPSLMGAGEKGRERRDNLRLLLHYARRYDSLQDFLAFIENAKRQKLEMKEAVQNDKEAASVKIMTVHGSKGLQFPVVFLCDTNRRPNRRDVTAPIIYDNRAGMGIMLSDLTKPARFNTACHKYVADVILDKQKGEELRLLYVAMTRAMEKLIITGSVRQRKADVRQEPVKAAEEESYLGLLLRRLEKEPSMCSFTRIAADEPIISSFGESEEQEQVFVDEEKIRKNLAFVYPYEKQTKAPAKVTATQLGVERSVMEDETDENAFYLSLPLFMKNGRKITGKERGDIYHKVMEYIDFSYKDAKGQLDRMAADGTLTADERGAVDTEEISRFLVGELCARIAAADEIKREFPVFTLVNPAEIPDPKPEDMSFLQGIADLYFVEKGEIVLVDYKTNRGVTAEYLTQTYSGQLAIYKKALEEMTGLHVKECVLYSFALGEAIEVNV